MDMTLQGFLQDRGWEEIDTLGRGARGPVLLIRNRKRDHKPSALKCSTSEELQALRALSDCRHVVRLEEQFSTSSIDAIWIRLEWLDGGSLRSFLRGQRPGKIPEDVSCWLLSQVLQGLVEIHGKGWVHRDIKAENIGLSAPVVSRSQLFECSVKLLDFDTAVRLPAASGKLTEVVGTVENMAPEVYAGSYTEKADCWSFGILAYEVLFGYRPFNDACIERIEEMVRNWQRYLVIPYDASEGSASFLRWLLSAERERSSSLQASRHPWMQNGSNAMSAELAAAAVTDVLEAKSISSMSTASKVAGTISIGGTPANCEPRGNFERQASLPSMPRSPKRGAALPMQRRATTSSTLDGISRAATTSSTLDGNEAFESLSRIRRSLSEWHAPAIGHTFEASTGRPGSFLSDQLTGSPKSRSSDAGPTVAAHASRPNKLAPDIGSSHAAEEAGSPSSAVSQEDYSQYLKSVRARTQEVMKAAEALSKPSNFASSSSTRSSPRKQDSFRKEEQLSRMPWQDSSPKQDYLGTSSASNHVPSPLETLEHLPPFSLKPKRNQAPANEALMDLKESKNRVNDLLSKLKEESDEAKAIRRNSAEAAAAETLPAKSGHKSSVADIDALGPAARKDDFASARRAGLAAAAAVENVVSSFSRNSTLGSRRSSGTSQLESEPSGISKGTRERHRLPQHEDTGTVARERSLSPASCLAQKQKHAGALLKKLRAASESSDYGDW